MEERRRRPWGLRGWRDEHSTREEDFWRPVRLGKKLFPCGPIAYPCRCIARHFCGHWTLTGAGKYCTVLAGSTRIAPFKDNDHSFSAKEG